MPRPAAPHPLHDAEWFRTLPPGERRAVERATTLSVVAPGRRLIREGSYDRCIYLVLEGTATVHRDGAPVAEVGSGHFVGEIGSLADVPRVADVWARTELTLLVATAPELAAMLVECPTVSRRLLRRLAELASEGLRRDADPLARSTVTG